MKLVTFKGASDDQVRFGSCDDPRPVLEVGHSYEVEKEEVHSWHTKIKLKGIKGKFNSVCFDESESTTTLPVEDVNRDKLLESWKEIVKESAQSHAGLQPGSRLLLNDWHKIYENSAFLFIERYLVGAQESEVDVETFKDAYVERNKEVNRLKEALQRIIDYPRSVDQSPQEVYDSLKEILNIAAQALAAHHQQGGKEVDIKKLVLDAVIAGQNNIDGDGSYVGIGEKETAHDILTLHGLQNVDKLYNLSPFTATGGYSEREKARFWAKVRQTDYCWEWMASRDTCGYGSIKISGNESKASRVAYEIINGEIKDGLHVLHHCDNPGCVNPDHLFLGTHQDNMLDKSRKGRGRMLGRSSKYLGVGWREDSKNWRAYAYIGRKHYSFGSWPTELEAAQKRDKGVKDKGLELPLNFDEHGNFIDRDVIDDDTIPAIDMEFVKWVSLGCYAWSEASKTFVHTDGNEYTTIQLYSLFKQSIL